MPVSWPGREFKYTRQTIKARVFKAKAILPGNDKALFVCLRCREYRTPLPNEVLCILIVNIRLAVLLLLGDI